MRVKKLRDEAILPIRAHSEDIGADIHSIEDVLIPSGEHRLVSTGISAQAPEGCYIRIAPRSGLAAKNAIDVYAGVVDSNYTGEIKVILMNSGKSIFTVNKGDRIAQLICERAVISEIVEVDSLENTERSSAGFGSTGV